MRKTKINYVTNWTIILKHLLFRHNFFVLWRGDVMLVLKEKEKNVNTYCIYCTKNCNSEIFTIHIILSWLFVTASSPLWKQNNSLAECFITLCDHSCGTRFMRYTHCSLFLKGSSTSLLVAKPSHLILTTVHWSDLRTPIHHLILNTDCWSACMQATGIAKDQIPLWSTFVHWRKRQFVLLHFLCKVFVFWLLYKHNQLEFKLSVITAENFLYITGGKISCHIRSRPFYIQLYVGTWYSWR